MNSQVKKYVTDKKVLENRQAWVTVVIIEDIIPLMIVLVFARLQNIMFGFFFAGSYLFLVWINDKDVIKWIKKKLGR